MYEIRTHLLTLCSRENLKILVCRSSLINTYKALPKGDILHINQNWVDAQGAYDSFFLGEINLIITWVIILFMF